MTPVLKLLILGAFCWLAYILFGEVRTASTVESVDSTRVILLFGGIVLVTVVIASIVALFILPRLGERLVGAVYNPNEEIERDPHCTALAKKANGDWEGAIREYLRCYVKNPEDSVALNDIIHLYTDKLGEPARAAALLERELKKEWPPEQAAFLGARLVDIYWNYQHDARRARDVLIQIAEAMPDTAHAANAQHRLREIDRILSEEEAHLPLGQSDSTPEIDTATAPEAGPSSPSTPT